jgi:hypothetical protein
MSYKEDELVARALEQLRQSERKRERDPRDAERGAIVLLGEDPGISWFLNGLAALQRVLNYGGIL